ncbi:hypothetical protein H489_0108300 [Curtobacterium flaccumfaciens UCD-AKU]|uniref:S1 family peptidase n=1 Tax=Curtobacterium flaccumfaciens TaxID=2035 RepID=UPI0003802638|nr:serine protease [Curtobacterium flaccumfaciens]EYT64760.1 hypothetical protein H489_0108300 [Curtobacterium flaccumfaciens UCD-AKU]
MSDAGTETLFEQLFYSTVRIEAHLSGGAMATGTGFIYAVPTSPDETAHFLVTNKHVVEGAESVSLYFLRADASGGHLLGKAYRMDVTELAAGGFQPHPEEDIDVTVMPLQAVFEQAKKDSAPVYFKSINSSQVPSLQQIAELNAVEDVRFVGYPAGIYDKENFFPVIRRGTTASFLQHDYEGRPTFLIDASVFPGSSGSPVFIADEGWFNTRTGVVFGSRVFLLGIVAAVHLSERAGRLVETSTQNTTTVPIVHDVLDLGVVYKSRTIDECVDLMLARYGLNRWESSSADEPTAAEAAAG